MAVAPRGADSLGFRRRTVALRRQSHARRFVSLRGQFVHAVHVDKGVIEVEQRDHHAREIHLVRRQRGARALAGRSSTGLGPIVRCVDENPERDLARRQIAPGQYAIDLIPPEILRGDRRVRAQSKETLALLRRHRGEELALARRQPSR